MKPFEEATNSLSILDRSDQVRIGPGERRMARAYLRQAGLLADILMRVYSVLRLVFEFVGHGIGTFARRSKASVVTPHRNEWSLP
jgi:hypothetical protein